MIAAIAARLTDRASPPLRLVESLAELDALEGKVPKAMPAAYVVPIREQAAPGVTTGRVRQRVTIWFGIVLITRNVSDLGRGGAAVADLAASRKATLDALMGWGEVAGVTSSPIQYRDGLLLDAANGLVAWQDTYETALYYQQV